MKKENGQGKNKNNIQLIENALNKVQASLLDSSLVLESRQEDGTVSKQTLTYQTNTQNEEGTSQATSE